MTSRQRKRSRRTWMVVEVDARLRAGKPLNVDDLVVGSNWCSSVGDYVDLRWGALGHPWGHA